MELPNKPFKQRWGDSQTPPPRNGKPLKKTGNQRWDRWIRNAALGCKLPGLELRRSGSVVLVTLHISKLQV